jgi:ubiquinol-cytochrome c reductase cytochrome c1 subunit
MIRQVTFAAISTLSLTATAAFSAGDGKQYIEDFAFSFEGPFGTFDQAQLQRGLKVYTEVCSACHGLRYVPLSLNHFTTSHHFGFEAAAFY